MHDDKLDEQRGGLKEFGGKVEKAAGDITGNDDLKNEGRKNEAGGKAQNIFGKAKNAVGDAVDNVKDAIDPNNKDSMVDDTTRHTHDHTHDSGHRH